MIPAYQAPAFPFFAASTGFYERFNLYQFGYPSIERISDTMLSSRELASMRSIDVKTCASPDLVDISRLHVNRNLPVYERIKQFVFDVGNPYLFRVNDTIVKVQYSEQGISLQERLARLMAPLTIGKENAVCYSTGCIDSKPQHAAINSFDGGM